MTHNNHTVKSLLILNIINHLGPISRTELIDVTEYRAATISGLIKELLDEKLISETGFQSVGHGRKRTLLEINKDRLCALGIAFSSNSVTYVVSGIDGSILARDTRHISQEESREALVERVTEDAATLLDRFRDKDVVGIGISEPFFDPTSYRRDSSLFANYAHFNDWIRLSLKPRLEATTGLNVNTYSAVTMPAMAELRFGAGRGVENFICVELSNGIGSSICCNGIPVRGGSGVAGELGHTVVSSNESLCYCGKPGCVESTTAFPALVAELHRAMDQGVFSCLNPEEPITTHAIRKALEEGDRLCLHLVRQIAQRIGLAIANAVNLLNPELVILHGFMLELGEWFLEQLEQSIRENTLIIASNFSLQISDKMEELLPMGAVAEVFSDYLRSDEYKWVYRLKQQEL